MTPQTEKTPDEVIPIGWLHIKIGQIFASLEDVRGTVGEMRDEVIRLRENQSSMRETISSMRETVTGVVAKIDATGRRIAELEEDIEPLAVMESAILTLQKDLTEIRPRVDRLDSMRLKFFGGIWTFTALASGTAVLLEVFRTVVLIHPSVLP